MRNNLVKVKLSNLVSVSLILIPAKWRKIFKIQAIFIKFIKFTIVGGLNLKSYEIWSKIVPCSLWLKITTSLLNTL